MLLQYSYFIIILQCCCNVRVVITNRMFFKIYYTEKKFALLNIH